MRARTTMAVWTCILAAAAWPRAAVTNVETTMSSGVGLQGSAWANNGGTACKRLLTPDFMGAILANPAGDSQPRPDGHGCVYGADGGDTTLMIELYEHISASDWDLNNKKYHPKGIPVAGVGDKAVRGEDAYSLYAWKTGDRTCAVVFMPLGSTPKLAGDALAKKFGAICNQLFASP
jgi:hypothetical protein